MEVSLQMRKRRRETDDNGDKLVKSCSFNSGERKGGNGPKINAGKEKCGKVGCVGKIIGTRNETLLWIPAFLT